MSTREYEAKVKLITDSSGTHVQVIGPGDTLWIAFHVNPKTAHMNMRAVDICIPLIKRIRKEQERGKGADRD